MFFGRVIMTLFFVCGLSGIFGEGIISRRTEKAGGFSIEYDRFLRRSKSNELIVRTQGLGKDSSLQINSNFLEKVKIHSLSPAPKLTEQKGGKLIFKFESPDVKHIILYVEPIKSGNQRLEISINNQKQVINQYIYF